MVDVGDFDHARLVTAGLELQNSSFASSLSGLVQGGEISRTEYDARLALFTEFVYAKFIAIM